MLQQPTLNQNVSFNPNPIQQQQPYNNAGMTQQPPIQQNQPWMNYDADCTRASTQTGLQAPLGFKPHEAENEIEEIIKGCFNGENTVYDHFERFATNGSLSKQEFSAAINSLGCSWPESRNDSIFSKLDFALNGKTQG